VEGSIRRGPLKELGRILKLSSREPFEKPRGMLHFEEQYVAFENGEVHILPLFIQSRSKQSRSSDGFYRVSFKEADLIEEVY